MWQGILVSIVVEIVSRLGGFLLGLGMDWLNDLQRNKKIDKAIDSGSADAIDDIIHGL